MLAPRLHLPSWYSRSNANRGLIPYGLRMNWCLRHDGLDPGAHVRETQGEVDCSPSCTARTAHAGSSVKCERVLGIGCPGFVKRRPQGHGFLEADGVAVFVGVGVSDAVCVFVGVTTSVTVSVGVSVSVEVIAGVGPT